MCTLAVSLAAQQPIPPDPVRRPADTPRTIPPATAIAVRRPPKNVFLDGWMVELLEADLGRARRIYQKAAASKGLPGYQSELALVRLRESSFDPRERVEARRQLESRGVYLSLSTPGLAGATSSLAREFREALANQELTKLAPLRTRLRQLAMQQSNAQPRPLTGQALAQLRGGANPEGNARLAELRAQRTAAQVRGDTSAAARINRQIRRIQWSNARRASDRLLGKRRAEMTRLHLAGEHERALTMERLLGTPMSRRSLRADAATTLANVRRWDAATKRTRLEDNVLKNLARLLQGNSSLLPEERAVLAQLDKRLRSDAEQGQWGRALVLAAHTPYRALLLR
ncbi:MAG: hypothetical protein KDC87_20230 [Planctomycetes bacterium]|nr:hypothetical protein [Planctomycetota bacterium]MCB9889242.1 hypothetical protein [Planctomycetota bacterium]